MNDKAKTELKETWGKWQIVDQVPETGDFEAIPLTDGKYAARFRKMPVMGIKTFYGAARTGIDPIMRLNHTHRFEFQTLDGDFVEGVYRSDNGLTIQVSLFSVNQK